MRLPDGAITARSGVGSALSLRHEIDGVDARAADGHRTPPRRWRLDPTPTHSARLWWRRGRARPGARQSPGTAAPRAGVFGALEAAYPVIGSRYTANSSRLVAVPPPAFRNTRPLRFHGTAAVRPDRREVVLAHDLHRRGGVVDDEQTAAAEGHERRAVVGGDERADGRVVRTHAGQLAGRCRSASYTSRRSTSPRGRGRTDWRRSRVLMRSSSFPFWLATSTAASSRVGTAACA